MGRESLRRLPWPMVISVLVVSYSAMSAAATEQCSNVTEDDDSGGSCTFRDGWCGWSNKDDDQLQWTRGGTGANSHLSIDMDGVRRGEVATLISPLLCATGNGTRSFRFFYYLEFTSRCRLSLHLVTGGTRTVEVWRSTRGEYYYQSVDDLGLECSDQPFQIMFIGEKLSNRSCGRYHNRIGIQDIVYHTTNFLTFFKLSTIGECPPAPPMTTTTTTSTTTTTTITTTTVSPTKSSTFGISNSTEHGPDKQTGEDGLSTGAIAGIVIVVVIIIVIIIIVIVCLIMRRRKKWTWRWKRSLPTVVKIRRSVTHRTHYMLGAQPNDTALPNLQRQPNPDVIPEPSAPPYPTDTTPLPEPSAPPPGLPKPPPPHPAILARKGQYGHKASSAAAAAAEGGTGDEDPCRDNAGEDAPAAVQYVNSGSVPQPRDREDQYNVLHKADHRGDEYPLPRATVPPGGNPYDHLNAGDGDYTHLGETKKQRENVEHYSAARRYSPECVTAPRNQSDDVGDRSRDDDVTNYVNECKYANDYANRSNESEYSVAQPLSGDDTSYYNSQEKQTVDPVTATDCEYSLAQHVRDGEEEREEESEDYYTCESVTPQQQKTPDKNTQYSLAQNIQHKGKKPAVVPKPKPKPKPDGGYSLAKTTEPKLNADATHKNHVTNGEVNRAQAHIQPNNPGEFATHENRPGDYMNVQNASSESGASKTGDNYNRLDFTERPGQQESEPEGTAAEYYNTSPTGRGGYDHLQLPPGNGAGEDLYCNVDGSRNASPC